MQSNIYLIDEFTSNINIWIHLNIYIIIKSKRSFQINNLNSKFLILLNFKQTII